ncbi:MAG: YlzJ-like family protein [Alicyclobacillaceae bacterium]|nr:YlzJ-like family protein [Alicyclobacillaceae bacterium]
MILYTIVPVEQVFSESTTPGPTMEMNAGQARLLVERLDEGRARIVRVISPNPNDYLRPHFQPGQIIEFLPVSRS